MSDLMECPECGELCNIDGEFPKFFAWCDKCDDYVDLGDYTADYLASRIDDAHDKEKYEKLEGE